MLAMSQTKQSHDEKGRAMDLSWLQAKLGRANRQDDQETADDSIDQHTNPHRPDAEGVMDQAGPNRTDC